MSSSSMPKAAASSCTCCPACTSNDPDTLGTSTLSISVRPPRSITWVYPTLHTERANVAVYFGDNFNVSGSPAAGAPSAAIVNVAPPSIDSPSRNQPANSHPAAGVATSVTSAPCAYTPAPSTLPISGCAESARTATHVCARSTANHPMTSSKSSTL